MDDTVSVSLAVIQESGMFAPVFFIMLHVFRQFLFIPVGLVCIVGGVMFGAVLGTIYSMVGIILTSILFYVAVTKLPNLFQKITQLKEKWFGHKMHLTVGQITILRLVPFIHFHLMSLCLIEMTRTFKEYVKLSLFTVIPLTVLYTAFGKWMSNLSIQAILAVLSILVILFYVMRRREWIIGWNEFFAFKNPQG